MIGELISETTGRRVVRRVISDDPTRVEVSFEDSGKALGISTNGFGTYTSTIRPDGTIYGEGQGLFTTAEGEGVSWKGSGVGKFTPNGGVSYRGMLFFRTTSQKFARLNAVGGAFEYEVDPKGGTVSKIWEWK
ncbi:MAG TPA: hypothetical protein VGZ48_00075 [Candidatus Acidoferrales bacterium]|jgi:hypothetical protein|nr:hypothetical protein [Candidatus Acidoferrales bacterium]